MTDQHSQGWEPDPRKMGNWRSMFEPRNGPPPSPMPPVYDDAALEEAGTPDLAVYHPWLLQRGRSRPALMLDLRRCDPRSGLWMGWAVSYPGLQAVEHMGERMVSLDFGARQFLLEGRGLDALVRHIQHGTVLAIMEYSERVWPTAPTGAVVSSIKRLGKEGVEASG